MFIISPGMGFVKGFFDFFLKDCAINMRSTLSRESFPKELKL